MKNKNFFSAMPLPLLSVLAVLVILGACKHPGGHEDEFPLGNGYGRISVQSVPVPGTSSRTVMPELAFDRFTYTFNKSVSGSFSVPDTLEAEPDSSGFFTLEIGSYTVTVEAYIGTVSGSFSVPDTVLVAAGVSEPFTVFAGDNDPVIVYLTEANTEAQGEFSYIVTYPEDAWGEITLKKYPEMRVVGLAPSHVCDSNGLTETVELNAGVYLLTVEVSMNGRYAGVTEAIHIYPSLTTVYDKDFIDADFTTIPPEIVEPPEPPTELPITGNVNFEYFWIDTHDSLVTTNNGIFNIAADETLAITSLIDGYSLLNWYLNGTNTEETGDTFYFSSATAGNHTIGLFVTKNGKLYNTNITVTVEAAAASVTRNITIDMFDSYGDGWGGNGALRINVNGIDIANNVRVSNLTTVNIPTGQRNTNTYTFTVSSGDFVELFWVTGSSQAENSFIVYYADTPPLPSFNRENNADWIGENALVVKLRGSMSGISGGSLLGSFLVADSF